MTDATIGGWTDTHCHVQHGNMECTADEALRAARSAGVTRFVVIGTDAESSAAAIELAGRHDDVWATVGLHPHDASLGVDSVEPLIGEKRVVAVGECGLDYHYDHSPRDTQRAAFARQIELARRRSLTLVVHTREAWDDTFDVLDSEGVPDNVVFHCFSGGPSEARRCLDRGAFLSFSGVVTFKNADDVREAARLCPSDRLLVETDSPYLAPVPHRGKPNQPALVAVVGAAIADIRGVEPSSFAATTTAAALLAFPKIGS